MIKRISYIYIAVLAMMITSCEMRDELRSKGVSTENQGIFELKVNSSEIETRVNTAEKLTVESLESIDNYIVRVTSYATGIVHKDCTYKELKDEGGNVKLVAGNYTVEVYNQSPVGFTSSTVPLYYAKNDFTVVAGRTTEVNATCKLNCVVVELNLSDNFKQKFNDDYTITISNGSDANFIYTKDNVNALTFYAVPKDSRSISMSVKATLKSGKKVSQSYVISKPVNADNNSVIVGGDAFKININPGEENVIENVTKVNFGVTVDLSWNNGEESIEIPTENIVFEEGQGEPSNQEPNNGELKIEGAEERVFHISQENEDRTVVVNIDAPRGIKNLFVEIKSDNSDFNQALTAMGITNKFDMANPGELKNILSNPFPNGLGLLEEGKELKGSKNFKFDITSFMGLLPTFGVSTYTFSIEVVDETDARVKKDLVIRMED